MLNLSRDINSLSNFKRNTSDFLERLKETQSPLVLTLNGVSELVVQSAEGYQALLDRLEYLETVAGIQRGLTELEQEQAVPALEALEQLRKNQSIALKDEDWSDFDVTLLDGLEEDYIDSSLMKVRPNSEN